jgi:hypothetical protein
MLTTKETVRGATRKEIMVNVRVIQSLMTSQIRAGTVKELLVMRGMPANQALTNGRRPIHRKPTLRKPNPPKLLSRVPAEAKALTRNPVTKGRI